MFSASSTTSEVMGGVFFCLKTVEQACFSRKYGSSMAMSKTLTEQYSKNLYYKKKNTALASSGSSSRLWELTVWQCDQMKNRFSGATTGLAVLLAWLAFVQSDPDDAPSNIHRDRCRANEVLAIETLMQCLMQGEAAEASSRFSLSNKLAGEIRSSLESVAAESKLHSVVEADLRTPSVLTFLREKMDHSEPVLLNGFLSMNVLHNITKSSFGARFGDVVTDFQTQRGCQNYDRLQGHEQISVSEWLQTHAHDWKLNQLPLWYHPSEPEATRDEDDQEAIDLVSMAPLIKDIAESWGYQIEPLRIDLHMGPDGLCHLPMHQDGNVANLACQIAGDKTWYICLTGHCLSYVCCLCIQHHLLTVVRPRYILPPSSSAKLIFDNGGEYGAGFSRSESSNAIFMSDHCTTSGINAQALAKLPKIKVRVRQGQCILLPEFWWHSTIYHAPTEKQAREHATAQMNLSVGTSMNFHWRCPDQTSASFPNLFCDSRQQMFTTVISP